jgi:hypothetical protein
MYLQEEVGRLRPP